MLGWVVKSRKEYHHRTALTRVRDAHATSPSTWTRKGTASRLEERGKISTAAAAMQPRELLLRRLDAVAAGVVVQNAHPAVERKMKRASYR
jgi:hypothetical protein